MAAPAVEAAAAAVHGAGLRLLERTGVEVRDDAARALLVAAGARAEGARVRVPSGAVATALAAAPSTFTLVGRRPARDLTFGAGSRVCATVSGAVAVVEGGRRRGATLADAEALARLGHRLPAVDLLGLGVTPLDLPPEARTRRALHALLTLSDKSIEWPAAGEADLALTVAANEVLYGAGWDGLPRALVVVNTDSPLVVAGQTARVVVEWARRGQPVCATSCVLAGLTGPVTWAGALAVQHAEVLATLVLAQAARPGAPFVYGGLSAPADLRAGSPRFGGAGFAAMARLTVALGRLLGVPVRAGGGLADAAVVDGRAAAESSLGLTAALEAGADFVLQAVGALAGASAASLEKCMLDDWFIASWRRAAQPPATDDEARAEAVAAAVGPGGGYRGQRHTRVHSRVADEPRLGEPCREDARPPSPAGTDDGAAPASAAARRAAALLEAHEPPDDLDAVVRRQLDRLCRGDA